MDMIRVLRKLLILPAFMLVGIAATAQEHKGHATDYDHSFMEKMVMHHQMGAPMLDMCVSKATHDELKQLCAKSKNDQQQEVEQMKAWLGPSGSTEHEMHGKMAAQHKQMDAKQKELEGKNGDDFERAFLPMLAKHHQSAIEMAKPCTVKAQKAELKQLCTEITSKQQEEKKQLLAWDAQWYGGKKSTTAAEKP